MIESCKKKKMSFCHPECHYAKLCHGLFPESFCENDENSIEEILSWLDICLDRIMNGTSDLIPIPIGMASAIANDIPIMSEVRPGPFKTSMEV
ncbi:MAG: hypothetical protein ACC608_09450 [Anaerofustis sp.]